MVDSSHLDFKAVVTGMVSITIDCKNEGYTLANGMITLTGMSDPSDCLS